MSSLIAECERAEQTLSYDYADATEERRIEKGAFYTPGDVARFFWNDYFTRQGIADRESAKALVEQYCFVEPSAGAGILFFAFLEKLISAGLEADDMAEIEATLIDVEAEPVRFVEKRIDGIACSAGLSPQNIHMLHGNFLTCALPVHQKKVFFFGNPPFVSQGADSGKWNNSFADFLSHSLDLAEGGGSVYFILPLALSFSRHYRELRARLRKENRAVTLVNFDNIPDTLFSSGKPRHTNTNKANSQRCSFFLCAAASGFHLASSSLIRWRKQERKQVFSTPHPCFDATEYHFDDQFPRPRTAGVLAYIAAASGSAALGGYCRPDGEYRFAVATVARNFIGIREDSSPGAHVLSFNDRDAFRQVFLAVISPLFMSYWLTTGDGFHLTKTTLMEFPVSDGFSKYLRENMKTAGELWTEREKYAKFKLNAGVMLKTFDYSGVCLPPFPV